MPHPRTALVAAAVLAVAGLSACAGGGPAAAPTGAAVAPVPSLVGSPTASGGSVDGVSASAAPGTPTTATASTPAGAAGTPSSRPGCLGGTVDVTFPGGGDQVRSVCVHVGTRIRITLDARPGAPWRAVVTSAPQVVALLDDTVGAGAVDATARAVAAGTAVLSADTRQHLGAPAEVTTHWQLDVTVVP
ncbi:hypothetical protein [Streptacidiphilus jiangxiensis]|uniref:Secreted protein n=1 Tax=Streptacidiphilus jiangxiensis TaxID=235985 RepID=A0A1H7V5A2_STRJI|nr:hypothetical protein [Streptacidiphilus jiangxiensis]SEM04068.1 hypothetical protein SAMN05414137_11774 [Streptacidiphilus jiangxiensis]